MLGEEELDSKGVYSAYFPFGSLVVVHFFIAFLHSSCSVLFCE